MQYFHWPVFATIALSLLSCGAPTAPKSSSSVYSPSSVELDELDHKAQAIVDGLTLTQKVGQMTQLNLDVISKGEIFNLDEPNEVDPDKLRKAIVDYGVGSILNCGGHTYDLEHWNKMLKQIQALAMESGANIPVIYGIDAIHGANYISNSTLFPQEIAQAATWNPSLVEQATSITAYETRAASLPWNFSPVLDLARQPLWSRFFETYGEDVVLAKTLGRAAIKGYEGDDVGNPEKVACTMKHFLGYSMPLTGKDRTSSWIDERQLREYFLPTFEEAIKQGAHSVMVNSGDINGIPVHTNKTILSDLLRGELGFKGVILTDWEDIWKLVTLHRTAVDKKEAVRQAIDAGIDMSMVPNDFEFCDLLIELVEEGAISEERIDRSVRRIIRLKMELGLFENPTVNPAEYPKFGSEEYAEVSYQAACEALTLVKNKAGILPLSAGKNYLVTGPGANSLNILNGAWMHTWQGDDTEYNPKDKKTILDALREELGQDQVKFVQGTQTDVAINIADAADAAAKSDVVIICLGEDPSAEKPGDIEDLTLPAPQIELCKAIAATGKPIVMVMSFNRPRLVSQVEGLAKAILLTYLPSNEGGRAIADVLTGKVNPSGKLPFTYPRNHGSLIAYDHKGTDQLDTKMGPDGFNPQWEFGFGMSYTSFEYSDITLSQPNITGDQTVDISVEVTNSGKKAGKEVVQLYINDLVASVTPSVKKLRAFQKISLAPGETQTVTFTIGRKDLSFIGIDNKRITEPGEFEVQVNGVSDVETFWVQ